MNLSTALASAFFILCHAAPAVSPVATSAVATFVTGRSILGADAELLAETSGTKIGQFQKALDR